LKNKALRFGTNLLKEGGYDMNRIDKFKFLPSFNI